MPDEFVPEHHGERSLLFDINWIAPPLLGATPNQIQMTDPVKQYQDALAKAEELKPKALQHLRNRKFEIESALAEVEREIASMIGEAVKATKPRAEKPAGKQISLRLLVDLLKDRPDKTLNIRKEGYDTKWIRQLVVDNPGQLTLGGQGPWPTVTLANGK
jgi:hypothetical protein